MDWLAFIYGAIVCMLAIGISFYLANFTVNLFNASGSSRDLIYTTMGFVVALILWGTLIFVVGGADVNQLTGILR
jgi:uncharacterized YccA/Bax inhibitor family protein